MHSLLESYLAEVEAKLSALPAKRREEELREMRQHLLSSMEANQGLGQSENEAAASALAEFGMSEKANESVLWAWRRDMRKKSIKTSWGMASVWTLNSIFDSVLWHKQSYQGYCITLCSWVLIMLMILSRYLPAKYQPSRLHSWFVPSAQ